MFGTLPNSNVGRSTSDNVGVQYGLKALKAGAITPEEFVTLNEQIGGVDADGNFVAAALGRRPDRRSTIAYRRGIVADGRHLAHAAIIDQRGYDNTNDVTLPGGGTGLGIHHTWRSFSERDRLDADAGSHAQPGAVALPRPG